MILFAAAAAPLACGPSTGGQDADANAVQVAPGVTFTLVDGEQSHREAPETFEIPPLPARQNLQPGQIVKLMFNIKAGDESQVERMWVIVEFREANGYVGSLDNQPLTTDQMRPGMTVRFQPRHVINIHPQRAGKKPDA
jgi:hypothetical protein